MEITAHSQIYDDAKKYSPFETGGVLLGYITKDGDYVITRIIPGGPKADRRAYSFQHDSDWQDDKMDKVWEETKGAEYYIGEWHTHPNNPTHMSVFDIDALKTIAAYPKCLNNPLMLIMGGKGFHETSVFSYPDISIDQKLEWKIFHKVTEQVAV